VTEQYSTVVLSAFVSRKVRLVYLDVIFSIKSFRNQIEYLPKFVLLPC